MSRPAGGQAVLLVLVGPTGTGKSEVAVRVARRIDGEIVGCDALQVYRGFDVATAKPDSAQRAAVAHHLVDCVDPATDFSLADYVGQADRAIADIAARGRVPLVVGGTGLYLRGLLRGVIEAPARNEALRGRLRRIVDRGGSKRLHAWLARHDPDSARRIAPADTQRLVRAVEIARTTGETWSGRLARQGSWRNGAERYRSLKLALDVERDRLGRRLDARVDRFFDGGLVQEVRRLLGGGLSPRANAFKALGYREVLGALERGEDPAAVRGLVQRNTRRYAKRQRSWFRGEPGLVWLDGSRGPEELADLVVRRWQHRATG